MIFELLWRERDVPPSMAGCSDLLHWMNGQWASRIMCLSLTYTLRCNSSLGGDDEGKTQRIGYV
ncbi:hypothetical protein K474DRAFT_1664441, partial [Panus rudis PR-1116 ss-1]